MATLYVKLDTDLTIALDADYKNTLWKTTDDVLNTIIRTDLTVHAAGAVRLAAAEALYALSMDKIITGSIFHIESDQEVNVFFDGSATAITIKPIGTYKGRLTLHGEFTVAPTVTNVSATTIANVEYVIAGVTA